MEPKRQNQNPGQKLKKIFELLFSAIGPRHWWPGDSPEEIIFGAILTQNTNWRNAKAAIDSLKEVGKLDFRLIRQMSVDELAPIIRSSGFFNQKAKALKDFAEYFGLRYGFHLEGMKAQDLWVLRQELLSIPRIGPETADSILLYALEKPIFVIDAYTRRIFSRHRFLPQEESYEAFQRLFMESLEPDVKLYNEYHALIVYTGHHFCRPRPLCSPCPLSRQSWEKGAKGFSKI